MHIDGNGIAGALQEILQPEVTSTERVCQSCHTRNAIGAHLAFHGAGMVLRCPHCGDVAATLTSTTNGYVMELRGGWIFSRV